MAAHYSGHNIPDSEDDMAHTETDSLDMRFRMLRQLLPHGSQLTDKDDILKVALEYVKELEREIQTFNAGCADDASAHEEMGALQRKGLCIMELSNLIAKAS